MNNKEFCRAINKLQNECLKEYNKHLTLRNFLIIMYGISFGLFLISVFLIFKK